jgi:Tfp pilus assembly protein PilO
MKEIFNVLNENERRLLRLLVLSLLFVLVFFFLVSLGQRRGYLDLKSELQVREKVASEAAKSRNASAEEWARWEEAYRDMVELKKTFFFKENEGVNELRVDLQKILAESGIAARSIRYNYANLEKGSFKRINVTFTFTGSYLILKRFLDTIERFSKFLLLEKIDFMKVSAGGSVLELRIILAGYYESI